MTIITKHFPSRLSIQWVAYEAEHDLGRPVGYGATEAEAIADLHEQLEELAYEHQHSS